MQAVLHLGKGSFCRLNVAVRHVRRNERAIVRVLLRAVSNAAARRRPDQRLRRGGLELGNDGAHAAHLALLAVHCGQQLVRELRR